MSTYPFTSALVTGAGAGIGRAIAELFAAAGAQVAVTDLDAATAESVAEGIVAAGGKAFGAACNVMQEEDLAAVVERTVSEFGGLTILVNNAGGGGPKPFDMPMADMRRAFELNLFSVFHLCQLAAPHMEAAGGGSILNITSMAAENRNKRMAAYASSKAAESHLTRNIAYDLGPMNIRVNAIAPGATKTAALESVLTPEIEQAMLKKEERFMAFFHPFSSMDILFVRKDSTPSCAVVHCPKVAGRVVRVSIRKLHGALWMFLLLRGHDTRRIGQRLGRQRAAREVELFELGQGLQRAQVGAQRGLGRGVDHPLLGGQPQRHAARLTRPGDRILERSPCRRATVCGESRDPRDVRPAIRRQRSETRPPDRDPVGPRFLGVELHERLARPQPREQRLQPLE